MILLKVKTLKIIGFLYKYSMIFKPYHICTLINTFESFEHIFYTIQKQILVQTHSYCTLIFKLTKGDQK